MKKYKCTECNTIFEEGEEAVWAEDRGEFWGVRCSESMSGCPKCHGDYEEVFECEECGGHFPEDEMEGGLCESCYEDLLYRES